MGCAGVACIGVDLLFLVLGIEQGSDNLKIVNMSRRGMDLYDELGLSANLRMELVAEKALASLLGPAGVDVFLPLLSRLIQPERLALARLDDLVLLGGVVLNANFREGGIDDARLPFGVEAPGTRS